jgi:hypothetical protein
MSSEIYYCGHCKQQQQVSQGEKCRSCKRPTLTWDTGKHGADWAQKQWEHFYGGS